EQEEPDAEAEPGPCPDTLKAGQAPAGDKPGVGGSVLKCSPFLEVSRPSSGPPTEEGSCTSSDDDTEGLRHRQGHEPHAGSPPPAPEPRRGTLDTGDENGLNVSKFLLGALALVAVGLLVVSGEWGSQRLCGGVQEGASPFHRRIPILPLLQGSQQNPPLRMDTGDPQSVQSMSFLLDKLAKENQEIRLMQAELQAHKEELHTLLRGAEGEATAGAQLQSLAAENARLRAALER
ncbi:PBIP1 protein, partial [Trogon melanurus]|nr:PBIP1 protein [Trogon melanurus]